MSYTKMLELHLLRFSFSFMKYGIKERQGLKISNVAKLYVPLSLPTSFETSGSKTLVDENEHCN